MDNQDPVDPNIASNLAVRVASGNVKYPASDALTNFLYMLMRDHLPAGIVEKLVQEIEQDRLIKHDEVVYTNGWLAQYANNLSIRIRESKC